MSEVGLQQALRGGLRPNYSSNSLAAAEQLGALIRHGSAGPGGTADQGMLFDAALGAGPEQSLMAPAPMAMAPPLQQHYPPGAGAHRGAHPFAQPNGIVACGGSCSVPVDRMEFPSSAALEMHMHPFRDAVAMNAVLRQADGAGLLGGMHPGMQASGMLPMMGYGPDSMQNPVMCGVSPVGQAESPGDYQQKRRFVWTPDLHGRFESACNQLGLDNAKPKSILRLMNVEGLTKANIKSHLQKYRCMMQKRLTFDAGAPSGAEPPAKAQKRSASSKPSGDDESSDGFGDNASDLGYPNSLQSDTVNGASEYTLLVHQQAPPSVATGSGHGQGPLALQQNLETQESTLRAQMDLQQQLSKQLQIQTRLQAEMEAMVQSRSSAGDDEASTKMNAILQMKQKLQSELQARLPPCGITASPAVFRLFPTLVSGRLSLWYQPCLGSRNINASS